MKTMRAVTSGPIIKSIWVPGSVRWHRAREPHMKWVWMLWVISVGLLFFWLCGMVTGHTMHGWTHALLGGAIITGSVCAFYGFKYAQYLERPFFKRMRNSKILRGLGREGVHRN